MALVQHRFERDVLAGDDGEFGDFKVQEASSCDARKTCQVFFRGYVVDLDFCRAPTIDLEGDDRSGPIRAKVRDCGGDAEAVSWGWCRNTLDGHYLVRAVLADAEVAVVGPSSDPRSLAVLA